MHWNPPADLSYQQKNEVVRSYFDEYKPAVVVETGLYGGRGSCYQFIDEAEVFAIDTEYENVVAARAAGVEAFQGDSGIMLPALLERILVPAFFWLDAHAVVEDRDLNSSPLFAELYAILNWPHAASSVILVDDVRMLGLPGWPTMAAVRVKISDMWDIEDRDDVLRLTPVADRAVRSIA